MVWKEPNSADQNGVITGYAVTYSSTLGLDNTVLGTTDTVIILAGLEEFTVYAVVVNASTAVGTGPGASTTQRTPGASTYVCVCVIALPIRALKIADPLPKAE